MIKRLLAIAYDLMLLLSILFFASFAVLPFTGGVAVESGNIFYFIYLLFCSYLYFAWQWTHGRQTLGMRAWRIRLVCPGSSVLNWQMATKRFFLACLSLLPAGLGFFWAIVDKEKLAFHDRFSGTFLIVD